MVLHTRRYVAEGLGTCLLTLLVSLSLVKSLMLATPLIAALVLGTMVYLLGPVSGAHLNPAVTVGLWSVKKISPQEAIFYIVSQIVGAVVAMMLLLSLAGALPTMDPRDTLQIALAELLGTAILAFGVTSVVLGRVKAEMSGIVIGSSLLLGILLASGASNGVINPAVAVGAGSLSATYIFAPLLGGIAGAWMARWIAK